VREECAVRSAAATARNVCLVEMGLLVGFFVHERRCAGRRYKKRTDVLRSTIARYSTGEARIGKKRGLWRKKVGGD